MPPLEEGVAARWLAQHVPAGSWILDPFGFSPRLVVESARAGYRTLVTVNNPITRFLLEIASDPPSEADFKAALAELSVARKGDERLSAHLQSAYLTTCEKCGAEIHADSYLWRKGENSPYARVYTCPQCGDSGERDATPQDAELARKMAATDSLHRSRAFERVAALNDEDRVYVEEAITHYLPRPLYVLTTILNRVDSLNLSPARRRALNALILAACDAGNTLWDHPPVRPRPKQLNIPAQFREFNIWNQLEAAIGLWTETASSVAFAAWPGKVPEEGGICIYEGRLKDLAHEVRKEIPIAAVIGSLPRPNQAFWTLSALWAGWLWGREAVEPYKLALRRRRYDWAWNATALNAACLHLFDLLPLGTRFFGLLAEPEPPFLTSALTATGAAGFDLQSLAMRTEHDPIQLLWQRGEHLKRESNPPSAMIVERAVRSYLADRGEPASYLHVHAAGLIGLAESHALKQQADEFDDAMRAIQSVIHSVLEKAVFVHYSSGENVDTGLWDIRDHRPESLSDRAEVAIVNYLQKNPTSIFLEVEDDVYPRFPGPLTPSRAIVYSIMDSYAERDGSEWRLRTEDVASARHSERENIAALIDAIGRRLGYSTRRQDKNHLWEESGEVARAFHLLASALLGRAIAESPYPAEQTLIVIPGGRAALAAYKAQRDPSLAARMKPYRVVKYRLLRSLIEVPVLTRETFEEQIAGDPLERSKTQMMMF